MRIQVSLKPHNLSPNSSEHTYVHSDFFAFSRFRRLGAKQVMRVGLDDRRRMDPQKLDEALTDLRSKGVPVVAVSAAACATPIGAFDPLEQIAEVCRRHDVWQHVDAAHGGAA